MPDPKEKEGGKMDEAIENISKTLGEKMEKFGEQVGERFSELGEKLEEGMKPKASAGAGNGDPKGKKPEEEFDWLGTSGTDEDDVPITKKELKQEFSKFLADVKKAAADQSKEVAEKTYEEKSSKNLRDNQAFQDFPEMLPGHESHNPDFEKEVNKEVSRRIKTGKSTDDPELVYDAASNVYAKMVREKKLVPKNVAERELQEQNNREDSFSVGGRSKRDASRPTKGMVELGKRMNVSEEAIQKHLDRSRKK
jgi:hypothetical protein